MLALLLIFLGLHVSAADIAGSKDHPALSRYPGSEIRFYKHDNWGSWTLMLADFESSVASQPKKSKPVEGARTRIAYTVPRGKSLHEVFSNYYQAVTKAGFKIHFKGQGSAVTPGVILTNYLGFSDICQGYYSTTENTFLFSAEKENVGLLVYATDCQGREDPKDFFVMVTVFDYKSVEGNQVKVNAEYFAKQIETEGFATLQGIAFDHNSDKILPTAYPVLREVQNLMKMKPALKLMIVGHTDQTGQIEYNTKLSQRRASAVKDYLIRILKIAPARLKSYGVGPLVPRRSNNTEAGRALNRRVELVPF